MEKSLIFSLFLFTLCFTSACAGLKKNSCSLDIPPVLIEHNNTLKKCNNFFNNYKCGDPDPPPAYSNKSWGEIKSDITFDLIQKLFASLGKTPEKRGRNWQLDTWSVDLDGDNLNEYVLLFWDDSEFYSTLCIMKKVSDEWKPIYADEIQGWSYRPTHFFVLNTHKEKTIVCSYESKTHASGLYQSRYRILKIIDGKIQTLLDIPQESRNCFAATEIRITPEGQGLSLTVSYMYSEGCMPLDGKEIILFEGLGNVNLGWDESKKSYLEYYGNNDSGKKIGLNERKFHFIVEDKYTEDPSFADVWRAELLEKRAKATPRERKAIDAILKKKTIAEPAL